MSNWIGDLNLIMEKVAGKKSGLLINFNVPVLKKGIKRIML